MFYGFAKYYSYMRKTPNGWNELSEDTYSSTVAFFKGGGKCVVSLENATRGDEVLIWQGVPKLIENDEEPYEITVFDGFDEDEVPDGADYIVETHKSNQEGSVNIEFAMDIMEARETAIQEMQNVNTGKY